MAFLERIFGSDSERALRPLKKIVETVNAHEKGMEGLAREDFAKKTQEFKERLSKGETLDGLLPEAFALVREATKHTLNIRHFDEQILGGIVLHNSNIAEMKTGEGKTLAAVLPAYLNALTEKGVHVVTVNDYLARRDAVLTGQIYALLGLSVGVITPESAYLYDAGHKEKDEERDETGTFKVVHEFLRPVGKKEAYAADVTYGTNNEFGFDYLRDNLAYEKEQIAQREYHFAIVDEVDSILIDEARTPLIISAPSTESEDLYKTFAGIARTLNKEEDYAIDEKLKAITLTDAGIEKAEKALGIDNIYTDKGIKYVHHLETAVRAKALFERDKDYVVQGDSVVIVDEFTGRLQPGRRWSEGLHQAIEAKEGVPIQKESRTVASITFQNYFRQYEKLSGMTGTAYTSREEFYKVYGLDVLVVPTHKPMIRDDRNDLIYQNLEGKFTAISRRIKEINETGQPVLIGTASVEHNELLSAYLRKEGVPHEMLNAKNHEREGEIIAQAGRKGAVTVATNMAGRGVDIKLGGNPSTHEEYEEVKNLGGLFVLGTERHESRRIDNQLRGRSGRQGDPGASQFYVSLDDPLMRIFAADTIKNVMGRIGVPEDQPVENKMISRSLESAQTKVEGHHFDVRKQILAYDDVLNQQRQSVYSRRRKLLFGDEAYIQEFIHDLVERYPESKDVIAHKREDLGEEEFTRKMRRTVLQVIDMLWMEHLEGMDYMRSSVHLRAYGQRDPLVEYRKEGLVMFNTMNESVFTHVAKVLPNMGEGAFVREKQELRAHHPQANKAAATAAPESGSSKPVIAGQKIGRNEVVQITNSTDTKEMKYKKAEPLLATGEWKLVEHT